MQFIDHDKELMRTLNEAQRRRFLGTNAIRYGRGGISATAWFFGVNRKTVAAGVKDVKGGYLPATGRVRRNGGGRKKATDKNPEITVVINEVIRDDIAGLPQDENVRWISKTPSQISQAVIDKGKHISPYIISQVLKKEGFRKRSFTKGLTVKESRNRDEQFRFIADMKEKCEQADIPVISIDTKKKELIGNFKRTGSVLSIGQPKSLDHDFANFAECKIVPHGIYDVRRNVGYMTIGISHDTSRFVCDNIKYVWQTYLSHEYPNARTIAVLCDGGGSNSSSHRIVKQDLMDLANEIGIKIIMMHYPPYCSKHNPIEHRLFSQITRSWSGEPLFSVENAVKRAAATTTKQGLKVFVSINEKAYETMRPIYLNFERRAKKQIISRSILPQWNYLVKPSQNVQVIF